MTRQVCQLGYSAIVKLNRKIKNFIKSYFLPLHSMPKWVVRLVTVVFLFRLMAMLWKSMIPNVKMVWVYTSQSVFQKMLMQSLQLLSMNKLVLRFHATTLQPIFSTKHCVKCLELTLSKKVHLYLQKCFDLTSLTFKNLPMKRLPK